MELQQRIPDRWFFRRLLPAAVFVVVAVVGGGQLGQAHWSDLGLARERVASTLVTSGGAGPRTLSALILLAVAVVLCALAVPLAAVGVDALASGSWPWWLVPAGERIRAARIRRWLPPEKLETEAVRARSRGHALRAARLDARKATAASTRPEYFTWCGDRFGATRRQIRERTGADITTAWTALQLLMPDSARTMLNDSRDSYDAACEAVVWSAATVVLGAWWWPALPAGLVLGAIAWRWLRRAVTAFCETTETVALLHTTDLPISLRSAQPPR